MNKSFLKPLSASLLAAILLASCGGTPATNNSSGSVGVSTPNQSGNSSSTSQASENSNLTEAGTFPIVKEKITLTYWAPLNTKYTATIKSFDELAITPIYEENTGVHIEWIHPVEETASEQFNLMVASKNLPDIIEQNWTGKPGGPEKAIKDNVIIDMTTLIDEYAPNYKEIMNSTEEGRKQVVTNDGRQYMMSGFYLGDTVKVKIMTGPQIRTDWLKRVGMEKPTTMEEWYKVLKAFKEQDANGNGDPNDEIPFVTASTKYSTLEDNITALAGGFGINMKYFHIDGAVQYGPYTDEYGEFLAEMNKWYQEGLIDPEFAATDKAMFDAKIFSNQAGAWYAGLMGDMGRYTKYCDDTEPTWEIAAVPRPIDGKTGKAFNFFSALNDIALTTGANITSTNKYPVETTRWLDYAFTEEGNRLLNNGVEGLTYNIIDGKIQFTDLILKNENGWDITTAISHYCRAGATVGAHMPDLAVMDARASHPLQQEARNEIWAAASGERTLPSLTVKAEDSQRQADIMNEVTPYVEEMFLKFIVGDEPLENFKAYQENLKKMGIEDAIKIQQAAYDAYQAR